MTSKQHKQFKCVKPETHTGYMKIENETAENDVQHKQKTLLQTVNIPIAHRKQALYGYNKAYTAPQYSPYCLV